VAAVKAVAGSLPRVRLRGHRYARRAQGAHRRPSTCPRMRDGLRHGHAAVRDLRKAWTCWGAAHPRHLVLNRADSRWASPGRSGRGCRRNFDWRSPVRSMCPFSQRGRPLLLATRLGVARRLAEFAEWLAAGEDDPAGAGGRAAPSEPPRCRTSGCRERAGSGCEADRPGPRAGVGKRTPGGRPVFSSAAGRESSGAAGLVPEAGRQPRMVWKQTPASCGQRCGSRSRSRATA